MTLLKKRPVKPDVSAAAARVDAAIENMRGSIGQVRELARLEAFNAAYESQTRSSIVDPETGSTMFPDLVWPRDLLDQHRIAFKGALTQVGSHLPAVTEACVELAEQLNDARRDAEGRAMTAEAAMLRVLAADTPRPCCGRSARESCTVEEVVIAGEHWRRTTYGAESRGGPTRGRPWTYPDCCPGCAVGLGALHHTGCVIEECPVGSSVGSHPFWNCQHERRSA